MRIPVTSTRSSDGLPCVGVIGALSGGGFEWYVAKKGRDRRTLRDPGWSNESLIGRLLVSGLYARVYHILCKGFANNIREFFEF